MLFQIMKKKIVYWLCERGFFKMAGRISPSLVSEWQGELLARKLTEGINTATKAIASFARALQKARDIEENYSRNSRL